jgi:hypothetical protein
MRIRDSLFCVGFALVMPARARAVRKYPIASTRHTPLTDKLLTNNRSKPQALGVLPVIEDGRQIQTAKITVSKSSKHQIALIVLGIIALCTRVSGLSLLRLHIVALQHSIMDSVAGLFDFGSVSLV